MLSYNVVANNQTTDNFSKINRIVTLVVSKDWREKRDPVWRLHTILCAKSFDDHGLHNTHAHKHDLTTLTIDWQLQNVQPNQIMSISQLGGSLSTVAIAQSEWCGEFVWLIVGGRPQSYSTCIWLKKACSKVNYKTYVQYAKSCVNKQASQKRGSYFIRN